jgi:hypothetical protein
MVFYLMRRRLPFGESAQVVRKKIQNPVMGKVQGANQVLALKARFVEKESKNSNDKKEIKMSDENNKNCPVVGNHGNR